MKRAIPPEIERLTLTKEQIKMVIKAIIKQWNKDPIANAKYILALHALLAAILVIPEETLQVIWRQVIGAFFDLYELNEMQRMAGEMPDAQFFVDRLIEKIERGEIGKPR